MKRVNTKKLAVIALLIALNVVLSRFLSINTPTLKIGFTFLTVMMSAYLFGIAGSVSVSGIADVVGALLFPSGPFFPGFTLTAVVNGVIYGVLMGKKINLPKISLAVVLSEILCSGLMNTLWISYLYGSDFKAVFTARLTTQILPMIIVQAVAGYLIFIKSRSMQKISAMIKK